jgi:L,D-peptidoglycan transpeptidase YkuD (ErfK/YbiS/YcfS/YnhG family)
VNGRAFRFVLGALCAMTVSANPTPAQLRAAEARVRTLAAAASEPFPLPRPELRIFKAAHRLELWAAGKRVATYPVGLGLAPEEDKLREGDHRTPEGQLYVCTRNDISKYHLFLGLSYPRPADAARGLKEGLITRAQNAAILDAHRRRTRPPWDTKLGGLVGIHGHGASSDWTWGCVALEDAAIEELWVACPLGTPVIIEK